MLLHLCYKNTGSEEDDGVPGNTDTGRGKFGVVLVSTVWQKEKGVGILFGR